MSEVVVVDACQREGRGGSPTAVLDEASYTDEERCRIPGELGTSHAVFIRAAGVERGRPSYSLRFFTAEGELPACGHGTVAALALLAIRSGDSDFHAVLSTKSRTFEGWAIRNRDNSVDTPHRTDHRPPQASSVTASFAPGPITLRAAQPPELKAVIAGLGLADEAVVNDDEGRVQSRRVADEIIVGDDDGEGRVRDRRLAGEVIVGNDDEGHVQTRRLAGEVIVGNDDEGHVQTRRLAGEVVIGNACVASNGRPRLLLPIRSRAALADLTPDFAQLRAACDRYGLLGCYAYSIPDRHGRAAARMFAPSIGVPEDIANANSTACLAAHLARSTPNHLTVATNHLTVDMGDRLGTPSTITATIDTTHPDHPVRVGGQATIARTVARQP